MYSIRAQLSAQRQEVQKTRQAGCDSQGYHPPTRAVQHHPQDHNGQVSRSGRQGNLGSCLECFETGESPVLRTVESAKDQEHRADLQHAGQFGLLECVRGQPARRQKHDHAHHRSRPPTHQIPHSQNTPDPLWLRAPHFRDVPRGGQTHAQTDQHPEHLHRTLDDPYLTIALLAYVARHHYGRHQSEQASKQYSQSRPERPVDEPVR